MKKVVAYVRQPYPSIPESEATFINNELEKLQATLNSLIEAVKELQAAVAALQSA